MGGGIVVIILLCIFIPIIAVACAVSPTLRKRVLASKPCVLLLERWARRKRRAVPPTLASVEISIDEPPAAAAEDETLAPAEANGGAATPSKAMDRAKEGMDRAKETARAAAKAAAKHASAAASAAKGVIEKQRAKGISHPSRTP